MATLGAILDYRVEMEVLEDFGICREIDDVAPSLRSSRSDDQDVR